MIQLPAPKPPRRPPPPPIPENIVEARSEKPILFVLFAPPMNVIWSLFTKRLTMALPSYRSLLPYPPYALPNQPCFMPGFTVRLMTVSSSPSSKPVIWAISLFLSSTCNLSIILAGRFLEATFGSSEKNSFPSTITFFTSFPLTVILPSLSTSTPGIFFNKSSKTEPSVTL